MRVWATVHGRLLLERVGGQLGRLGVGVDGVAVGARDAPSRRAAAANAVCSTAARASPPSRGRAASALWKSTSTRW